MKESTRLVAISNKTENHDNGCHRFSDVALFSTGKPCYNAEKGSSKCAMCVWYKKAMGIKE